MDGWMKDANGNVTFMPLAEFATATLRQMLAGLRLDVVPSPEDLGKRTATVQICMSPDQATELGQALLRMADAARNGRPSTPQ